jgi:hypothetical protein
MGGMGGGGMGGMGGGGMGGGGMGGGGMFAVPVSPQVPGQGANTFQEKKMK